MEQPQHQAGGRRTGKVVKRSGARIFILEDHQNPDVPEKVSQVVHEGTRSSGAKPCLFFFPWSVVKCIAMILQPLSFYVRLTQR